MEHNHLRDCPDNPIIVEVNTEHLLYKKELFKKIYTMGSSVNDVTHLGGEGSAKRWHYSIRLICTMDDKGEGGFKFLKKLVTSFMDADGPYCKKKKLITIL